MPRKYGITNAQVLSSPPATHMEGDLYWNLTQDKLYVSDGTQWVPVDTAQSEVALASSAPTPVANLPELWIDLAASDTSAIPVSSVWPAGDLAPFSASASFPSTAGQPTYIDSAGKIRAAPQALWRDNPDVADPPETYPFGVTVMTLSTAQASAGGWYSTGLVVTSRRYSDNPGIAAQWFYANSTSAPIAMYRSGNGANATKWSPWITAAQDSGWVDISITTGFTAQGTEKPQVRNLNGVIYSRGGWSGTGLTVSTTLDPVGTVPVGYRPTQNVLWRGGTGTGAALAQVFINNSGAVSIRMGPTATYVMLGGSWLTT